MILVDASFLRNGYIYQFIGVTRCIYRATVTTNCRHPCLNEDAVITSIGPAMIGRLAGNGHSCAPP